MYINIFFYSLEKEKCFALKDQDLYQSAANEMAKQHPTDVDDDDSTVYDNDERNGRMRILKLLMSGVNNCVHAYPGAFFQLAKKTNVDYIIILILAILPEFKDAWVSFKSIFHLNDNGTPLDTYHFPHFSHRCKKCNKSYNFHGELDKNPNLRHGNYWNLHKNRNGVLTFMCNTCFQKH